MITIHRRTAAGLETVDRPVKGCWIDVIDPTPAEVESLPQDWGLSPEFAAAALDLDEIPTIAKAEGALLIVVRIPHFQSATAAIPYVTLPLGIIVTEDWVITLCRQPHDLLRELPHEHATDLAAAKPARLVLQLLWRVANRYIHHLNEINRIVEGLEDRLQRSLQNREVLELLRYQKSLVHFTTALRANETMLERLQRSDYLALERKDESLLDDVFTENRQAIGMSEIASDILSQMMDAFASIISNNLNVVMKFLAAVTVILIVPTILSTFFGMNVRLPLADQPAAFWILVGLSVLLSLLVGWIFWKKNWL